MVGFYGLAVIILITRFLEMLLWGITELRELDNYVISDTF
jgi:hypothetical protein